MCFSLPVVLLTHECETNWPGCQKTGYFKRAKTEVFSDSKNMEAFALLMPPALCAKDFNGNKKLRRFRGKKSPLGKGTGGLKQKAAEVVMGRGQSRNICHELSE